MTSRPIRDRESGYRILHQQSMRRMRLRRTADTMPALLRALSEAVWWETPGEIHGSEIETGGHLRLGADFIAYVDNPWSRDIDGYYRFPLKASLAFMANGPRGGSGDPFMARFVYALSRGADWRTLGAERGWDDERSRAYAEAALRRWRDCYRDFPSVRPRSN